MKQQLVSACDRWGLLGPREVARSPRAIVYRVEREGDPLALKLLTPEGQASEHTAPALLRHWAGKGCVGLIDAVGNSVLMEWLDGPSLGDLVRQGDDDFCARELAHVAIRLHETPGRIASAVMLDRTFRALWKAENLSPEMTRACTIAREIVSAGATQALLHGDLHHDNILSGPRGWTAIDPKGIIGDPAYELANAFRNPVGMEVEAANPARIDRLGAIFSEITGVPVDRIVAFAAAHCALSLCWSGAADNPAHADHAILAALLARTI